jgi:hypothetical protein
MSIKINRLEEGHNSYPLVCRRPAETVSLQREECICCVEVPAAHSQMLSEDMQCITFTDSDIFISNCLNRHVLTVGKKKNRYGANVNERISDVTG